MRPRGPVTCDLGPRALVASLVHQALHDLVHQPVGMRSPQWRAERVQILAWFESDDVRQPAEAGGYTFLYAADVLGLDVEAARAEARRRFGRHARPAQGVRSERAEAR